jgi:hypothetical protein
MDAPWRPRTPADVQAWRTRFQTAAVVSFTLALASGNDAAATFYARKWVLFGSVAQLLHFTELALHGDSGSARLRRGPE